ncbi:MAG: hypothetical protein AAF604_17940 [Acidobacteriota bacterium]
MMRRALILAVLGLLTVGGSLSGLELVSGSKSLTIARVPADSELWLFGVGKSRDGYNRVLTTYSETLSDADGDGRIIYEPAGGMPVLASWGVADLTTGQVTVLPSPGWEGSVSSLPATALDPSGESLTLPNRQVEAFLVRPGTAGWRQSIGDGSSADGDGLEDGSVNLSLSSLAAQDGGSELPGSLQPEDVLVVIDTSTLELIWSGEEVSP